MNRTLPSILGLLLTLVCLGWLFSQQPGTGRVEGTIRMGDAHTGKPLADVMVYLNAEHGDDFYSARTDSDGRFTMRRVRVGSYKLITYADHHKGEGAATVVEAETARADLGLVRSEPALNIGYSRQKVFTTSETPRLPITGYADAKTLEVRVRRCRISDVLGLPEGEDALGQLDQTYDGPRTKLPPALTTARSEAPQNRVAPVAKPDNEGFFTQRLELPVPKGKPGLYLAEVRSGKASVCTYVIVTDMALIVKSPERQGARTLVYAIDQTTGKPVAGAQVARWGTAETATDANGLAWLAPAPPNPTGRVALIVARRGEDEAVLRGDQGEDERGDDLVVHFHTDRPIYRPGHTIQYKAIVRRRGGPDDPTRYALPAGMPATVVVRDAAGNEIGRQKTTLSATGSLFGSVDVSPEAPTGVYTLEARLAGEKHERTVPVSSYRKPEFEVKVTPDKKQALLGETVQLTIEGAYYYGAPTAGAKVRYSVYREIDWAADQGGADDDLNEDDRERFGGRYYGSQVADGEGVLDASGRLQVTFDARAESDDPESDGEPHERDDQPQAQTFNCSVTVTDATDREVEAEATVHATAARWLIAAAPEGYVGEPGKATPILVNVRDTSGKPIPGAPVTLEARRSRWDPKTETTVSETAGPPLTGTTGADGRAVLPFTPPRRGDWELTARVQDADGRTALTRTSLWVTNDRDPDLDTQYDDLTLLTDKRRYAPGDTARVVLNTFRVGQTALLTVESDAVHAVFSVPIRQRSTVVRVPIRASYGPNVFLNASYVRNKKFAESDVTLRVSTPAQALQVSVTPAAPTSLPGRQTACDVLIRDASGRPVATEFSLGVVDEAIFAIQEDDPRDLRNDFYPARSHGVRTRHSFAIGYLGGDEKGEPPILARKKFLDTALWRPVLTTGADGRAHIPIPLPDNLTAWRITVKACTVEGTRIGYGKARFTVAKPFSVQLEAPRFVTEGDRTRLVALVHNDTQKPLGATVRLTAGDLLDGVDEAQKVNVPAGGVARAEWPIVARQPADVPLRLTAWSDDRTLTDGVLARLDVRPFGREETWTDAGALELATRDIDVPVSAGAIPGQSRLTVRVTPGLGGAVGAALEYLVGFPYGCTEQTMSRFLPDVLARRADPSLLTRSQSRDLPAMVRDGLARLGRFQHGTGGWGWWEHDADDTFMTAYVLYGLVEARAAGWSVPPTMIENGAKQLVKMPATPFALYALARAGYPSGAALAPPKGMTTGELGWATLLRRTRGQAGGPYLAELLRRRRVEGPLTYWSGARDRKALWWQVWDESDRMDTATAVRALLACDPNDPSAKAGIRWLLAQRTDGAFGDTRDTSWTLAALCDYLALHPEARSVPAALALRVGDTDVPLVGDERERLARVPSRLLRAGANARLTLSATGGGDLSTVFWSVSLRQTIAPERDAGLAPRTPENITLGREYLRTPSPKDGSLAAPEVQTRFQAGDGVEVRLTLINPTELQYALLEDAFPAGLEPTERGTAEVEQNGDWTAPYSNLDVRDDRVAFFFRRLPAGKHVLTYHLRAQTPGRFKVVPAVLGPMYRPSLRVESRDSQVEVSP